MPEIYLKSRRGHWFGVSNREGQQHRFSVAKGTSVIELLFTFYDPDFLPAIITVYFLTAEGWRKQDLKTEKMGLTIPKKNGSEVGYSNEVSYGDTLTALYSYLLALQENKAAREVLAPALIEEFPELAFTE